jgi:hypothetical protein
MDLSKITTAEVEALLRLLFGFESRGLIAGLFIASMLAFIGGLIAFLREVFVAVKSLTLWFSRNES